MSFVPFSPGGSVTIQDLWAHWKMNGSGNAADSAGSSRDLTENGTVPNGVGKINGRRGVFTAANYFERAVSDFDSTKDLTITLWYYCQNATPGDMFFIKCHNDGVADRFGFWVIFDQASDKIFLTVDTDSATNCGKAIVLSAGVWFHLICTYDGTTGDMAVYIDNGTPETDTFGGAAGGATNIMYVGSTDGGAVPADQAYIDDLRIYNRVLTAKERAAIYNSGNGTEANAITSNKGILYSNSQGACV